MRRASCAASCAASCVVRRACVVRHALRRASCAASCAASCVVRCVVRRALRRASCMRSWELMGTYGNLWELMGTYGNLWELMGTCGNSWELMGSSCVFLRCKAFFQCVFSLGVAHFDYMRTTRTTRTIDFSNKILLS